MINKLSCAFCQTVLFCVKREVFGGCWYSWWGNKLIDLFPFVASHTVLAFSACEWASLLETLLCLFKLTERFKTWPKKQHNIYRSSVWQMLSNACFASRLLQFSKNQEEGGRERFRKVQPLCLIFVFQFSLLISKPGFTLNLVKGLVWLIRMTFDFDFTRIEWRLVQRKFTV